MSGQSATPRASVLVIDDRENMLRMMRELLQERFEVITCRSGPEGLEVFRQSLPDLVVTDVRMPDVSGMDVLRAVKKHSPDTEVVLMTAYGEIGQAVEAVKAGAYHYVLKPFEPEEMLLTLEKALERKRLRERTAVLQREVEGKFGFHNIVGQSKAMQQAFEMARKASASPAPAAATASWR